MGNITEYAGNRPAERYDVTFVVNSTNERLTRSFDSEFMARKFVNKLKHSKRCTLTAYPVFR